MTRQFGSLNFNRRRRQILDQATDDYSPSPVADLLRFKRRESPHSAVWKRAARELLEQLKSHLTRSPERPEYAPATWKRVAAEMIDRVVYPFVFGVAILPPTMLFGGSLVWLWLTAVFFRHLLCDYPPARPGFGKRLFGLRAWSEIGPGKMLPLRVMLRRFLPAASLTMYLLAFVSWQQSSALKLITAALICDLIELLVMSANTKGKRPLDYATDTVVISVPTRKRCDDCGGKLPPGCSRCPRCDAQDLAA